MDKLTSSARKIDVFFRIVEVMFKIAFVACLVGLGIVLVGTVFDLPEEAIGYIDTQLQFGPLNLHVANDCLPSFDRMLMFTSAMLVLGAAVCFLMIRCMKVIRAIMAPMKAGEPFVSEISANLRKLGWYSLVACIAVQVTEAAGLYIIAAMYRIETLLISEKITHVDINASFDLGILIIPAVFFLLAYVFKYGEQLQVLSDETL
nr:hypothetical protein [Clostridia bacterium]